MITLGEISKSEAARYMGIRTAPDDMTAELLDKYEEIVRSRLKPAYVFREADVEISAEGIYLSGLSVPLTGKSIAKLLHGCHKAIVFAATVSAEADRLIREISVTDMAAAVVTDSLCSAAIEQVCDRVEIEIFGDMPKEQHTYRFSPGYGDLPIELQKDLLVYLNAQRRIGLSCTDSYMLTPTKSVTAIIGIKTVRE
ncbi:MAG: 5-methyltetrahydrofolate--homocysteine methyltransferase [Ruminococcus sp.]|nr:5-methyltetrahydrofolate--homocysteine methyltransferase [Ruminococcus sp.]